MIPLGQCIMEGEQLLWLPMFRASFFASCFKLKFPPKSIFNFVKTSTKLTQIFEILMGTELKLKPDGQVFEALLSACTSNSEQ